MVRETLICVTVITNREQVQNYKALLNSKNKISHKGRRGGNSYFCQVTFLASFRLAIFIPAAYYERKSASFIFSRQRERFLAKWKLLSWVPVGPFLPFC
jgi:hypothetical protein